MEVEGSGGNRQGGTGGKDYHGHKETSRCDIFIILIEEMVSWVFYIF